jgi:hypothetical protein
MLLASSLQSMFGEGISAWEVRLDQKFRKTALWIRTLEERQGPDPDKDSRARLRTAFLSMRERISPLAAQVHQDCDGLTVHDVTHLDALWETADKIIGNDYQMNPVEGFVFGAALLIHDAGMAIAAYPNRMNDIRETKEWRDAVSARLRRAGHPITDEAIAEPPSTILRGAIFHVLRALHAMQAEHLMKMTWGGGSERFHLLDDVDLRQFYGPRVGRIAHSHHWNLDEIGSGLQGIAYAGADEFYVGLLSGAVPNDTRREAELRVPQHLLAEWATEQACTTEKHKCDLFTLVSAAQQVRRLGGCAGDLPLYFVGGRFMPEQHLRTLVRSLDSIHILALERPGTRRLAWFALEDLSPRYLMGELIPNIFVANTESNIIFDDNRESRDGEDMQFTFDESAFHDRDGGVDVLIDLAKEEWGNFSALTVFRGDYYVAPPLSVVVTLSRA